MAQIIKAPESIAGTDKTYKVFLAGSIDMGKAVNWQEKIELSLAEHDRITVLNPRRDDWDSSWKQTLDDERFAEQVEWEYQGLEAANLIALYFSDESKAPISFLELGMFASSGKIIVRCTKKFYRYGNVEFVCKKYNIPLFSDDKKFIDEIKNRATSAKSVKENFSILHKM